MSQRGPRGRLIVFGLLVLAGLGAFVLWRLGSGKEQQLAEARRASAARDFPRAQSVLDAYLKDHPRDPDALLLAAQVARRARDFSQAGQFLRAYERNAGSAEVVAREEQLRRAGLGDPVAADALVRECESRPGSPDNYPALEAVVSGLKASLEAKEKAHERVADGPEAGRGIRAAELLLQTPMSQADQAEAYLWSGVIHRAALRYPRAVADLRKALDLAPGHFEARKALALTIGQENPAEARWHYEQLVRERPDDLPAKYELASLYRGLGQTAEAGRLLDEVLQKNPEDVQALIERGNVELDAGRPDLAEPYLRRAAQAAPEFAPGLPPLSRCLRELGQPAEADRLIRRFQELEARQKGKGP